jgi:hypothetical protein
VIYDEWYAKGKELFGDDTMQWRFVCPACGHVASAQDWKDAGAPEAVVAFCCVGRYLPNPKEAFSGDGGPCSYTGGGLFRLNPIDVDGRPTFAFAEPVPQQEAR